MRALCCSMNTVAAHMNAAYIGASRARLPCASSTEPGSPGYSSMSGAASPRIAASACSTKLLATCGLLHLDLTPATRAGAGVDRRADAHRTLAAREGVGVGGVARQRAQLAFMVCGVGRRPALLGARDVRVFGHGAAVLDARLVDLDLREGTVELGRPLRAAACARTRPNDRDEGQRVGGRP